MVKRKIAIGILGAGLMIACGGSSKPAEDPNDQPMEFVSDLEGPSEGASDSDTSDSGAADVDAADPEAQTEGEMSAEPVDEFADESDGE